MEWSKSVPFSHKPILRISIDTTREEPFAKKVKTALKTGMAVHSFKANLDQFRVDA